MIGHFATDAESLAEVRQEFDQKIGRWPGLAKRSGGSEGETLGAYLDKVVTLTDCQELDYLNMVICEALRVSPPVPSSSMYMVTQDARLGKYDFRAGDSLVVNFSGLHMSASEWQRPCEFLPRRFDPSHELSRTPAGAKRNPYAWSPFNGGRRICFGKTFAEANLRIVGTYLSQYFDFEFVDKARYNRGNLPLNEIGQASFPPIEVVLSLRQKCD